MPCTSKLAARAPLEAREASQALMLAFAGLLISLIGEPLTDRLLLSAWGGRRSRRARPGETAMTDKVVIRRLPTGVPGLDAVLGGGLAEFSFNLIAGAPGCGQDHAGAPDHVRAGRRPTGRALYFTVLGEPPLKMLRYQQQFGFFDVEKINQSIRFVNLADDVARPATSTACWRASSRRSRRFEPGLVFVDSFRSVVACGERRRRPCHRTCSSSCSGSACT